MLTVTSTGGSSTKIVVDREKSSSGNQMMKMSKNSNSPPMPYFTTARLLTPLSTGNAYPATSLHDTATVTKHNS